MFSRTFRTKHGTKLILSNHAHFLDKNCLIFLLLQRDLFEARKLKDVGLNHIFVPGKHSAHSVAAYTEEECKMVRNIGLGGRQEDLGSNPSPNSYWHVHLAQQRL